MSDQSSIGFHQPTTVEIRAETYRALVRDASRYRWLREAKFLEIVTENELFRVAGGDNLDKTVDVAATP